MDRNTLTGILLILGILLAFSYMNRDNTTQEERVVDSNNQSPKNHFEQLNDTLPKQNNLLNEIDSANNFNDSTDSIQAPVVDPRFGIFTPASKGNNKCYKIENQKLIVELCAKGGGISSVKLKDYKTYKAYINNNDNAPLQLFDKDSTIQNFILSRRNSVDIETKDLFFDLVDKSDERIVLRAPTSNSSQYIQYTYIMSDDKFDLDFNVEIINLNEELSSKINFEWRMKSLSTEKDVANERDISTILFHEVNGDYDYLGQRVDDEEKLDYRTDWIAFKHQYFSSIVMYNDGYERGTFVKTGPAASKKYAYKYMANMRMDRNINANTNIDLKFYFGPNDYETLRSYQNGMDDIPDFGISIIRWLNKNMMTPIFKFLKGFNWNIGILIIIITLIVRLIILPITYKNYQSSARMRVLRPDIEKINKKYPDGGDAMKKQQEVMALYRKAGVNPMAGCIPALIQMPLLYAAFRFFPSIMDLRQESFLWAEDLSTYDSLISWEGNIPIITWLLGNHISLFTVAMSVTTLIYSRMSSGQMAQSSQPGMPNMKVIMTLMPIMFFFFLNRYSSGLTFYYFCGNIITIGLMYLVKTFMIDENKIRAKIEENKKKPKKKSRFQQRLEDLQKEQEKRRKK